MFDTKTRRIKFPDQIFSNFDQLFDIFNEDIKMSYDVQPDKDFMVELPLPGLDKEHLSIEISGKTLIVKTKVKNADGFIKRYMDNSYSYYVSDVHDLSKTEAKMENGLLKITIPLKKKQEAKNITVEVK